MIKLLALLPQKVKVPDGIVEIGDDAFSHCECLRNILLPDSLKTIGSYAFAYSGLTDLVIPEGVERMDGMALLNCDDLTTVTLPQSLTSISTIYPTQVVFYVPTGSYAEEYARTHDLTYKTLENAQ